MELYVGLLWRFIIDNTLFQNSNTQTDLEEIPAYAWSNKYIIYRRHKKKGFSTKRIVFTLQSLMLFTTWLYSLLKVCVSRRRHCRVREHNAWREQKQQRQSVSWRRFSSHLCGQLLLTVHQALDVCGVVAAAFTGGDGAFKGCAGDLRGDGRGGGQSPWAHAGGQRLAQKLCGRGGSHWSCLSELFSEQEKVTRLLHLDKQQGKFEHL